jgi:hypothetical protein
LFVDRIKARDIVDAHDGLSRGDGGLFGLVRGVCEGAEQYKQEQEHRSAHVVSWWRGFTRVHVIRNKSPA